MWIQPDSLYVALGAFAFLPLWLPLALCVFPDRVTKVIFRDLWLVVFGSIALDLLGLLLTIIVGHWRPDLGEKIGFVVMCMSFNILPAVWLAFAGTLGRLVLALRRRWRPAPPGSSANAVEPSQCPIPG